MYQTIIMIYSMIEMHCLKNVIFFPKNFKFVLSEKVFINLVFTKTISKNDTLFHKDKSDMAGRNGQNRALQNVF